jgi:hypothetical protein
MHYFPYLLSLLCLFVKSNLPLPVEFRGNWCLDALLLEPLFKKQDTFACVSTFSGSSDVQL